MRRVVREIVKILLLWPTLFALWFVGLELMFRYIRDAAESDDSLPDL